MPFVTAVVNDVVPMIDKTYRTIPDREHRAMAGPVSRRNSDVSNHADQPR